MTRIGFAGLGRMGRLMAANLIAAGFDIVVWNRTQQVAQDFALQYSVEYVSDPIDLANSCDCIVTMLADDVSSQQVHYGDTGLFAGARAKTFVEMGTMSRDHILALAQGCRADVQVIDAPVSGATQAAAAGTLMVMLGASQQNGQAIAPILDAMASKVLFLGKIGDGAVMKLAVNSLIHGINQTFSEAMNMAGAAGIAPDLAYDVVQASAACAPMLTYRRPLYLNEAENDVTFTVSLARKDMQVMTDLARNLGVATPQADITLDQLKLAETAGYGARDMAAMLAFAKENSK